MTSYLRSWLYGGISDAEESTVPSIERISPPPEDEPDDGEETETERDYDRPPAFPAPNSAQRASSASTPPTLTDAQLMPPPPLPTSLSKGNMLAVPPRTERPPSRKREKVALAPGYGPLDWAALKASNANLRVSSSSIFSWAHLLIAQWKGVDTLMRIPPSVIKKHNKLDDAWSSINGKVYNITPYLKYHPGGEKELMRIAGRDGTKLFGMVP